MSSYEAMVALATACVKSIQGAVRVHLWARITAQHINGVHYSLGLIAISALATADTPQTNPTGKSRGPDWGVLSRGRKTATWAADARASPVIRVRFEGSEKLFWLAASCKLQCAEHPSRVLVTQKHQQSTV